MIRAKVVMNTSVITAGPEEDLYEAMRMMTLHNITGLPVVDEDANLLGIITEKDILALLYPSLEEASLDRVVGRVGDFMTRNVVCFAPEDTLSEVAECLSTNDFRRVPILDDGRLVGIISRRDVLRYLRELQQQDDVRKDSVLELLY